MGVFTAIPICQIGFQTPLGAFEKCKKRLLASSRLSVDLSVRMEQLGYNWTDFHEILYLSIFENLLRRLKFHYIGQ